MYYKSDGTFVCTLLLCKNERLYNRIVVFSVRIFRYSVVGHEFVFKCCDVKLVSERWIVSLLDRVVDVKPTYILLFSEIQSPKGQSN